MDTVNEEVYERALIRRVLSCAMFMDSVALVLVIWWTADRSSEVAVARLEIALIMVLTVSEVSGGWLRFSAMLAVFPSGALNIVLVVFAVSIATQSFLVRKKNNLKLGHVSRVFSPSFPGFSIFV